MGGTWMPRRKSPTLTDGELRLMQILWDRGSGTVNDLVEALPPDTELAYKTVLTTARILESKGYVRHEKRGRAFVYFPVIGKGHASRNALHYLLSRFFDNSPSALMVNLLEDEQLDKREVARLRKLVQETHRRS
jgi:predicted transcriptional regulator